MDINHLIERLASDARPVKRDSFLTKIWLPLVLGASGGIFIMAISIGLRPGAEKADNFAQLMVGMGLGLGSAIAGLAALLRSLRPDMGSTSPKQILTAVLIVLFSVAIAQLLAHNPSGSVLLFDASPGCSPWMVVLIAIPSFVLLAARVRSWAPTHLNVSGAALGLTSGGVGASIYAFGCSEGFASLGLAWLSVGISVATLAGKLS